MSENKLLRHSLVTFMALIMLLGIFMGLGGITAYAEETAQGLEIARFDYVKDNKISVTVTMDDALRSKNGTVLVELLNEGNMLVSSMKSAAFAQYSYTFDKESYYCGKYIVKVSYLENSTSSTLLCDAVTKEFEGRHNITNHASFPDKDKHWGSCSACGSWCSQSHSFTEEHFDDKGSWMQCECGAKNIETFTPHTHSTQWSQNDVAHYHGCTTCEHRADAAPHYYYNDCARTCAVCGYVRSVPPHFYSGNCDNTCNICGYVRNIVVLHKYSSDCDTKCDGCGIAREATAEHTFASGCDADCELCGETRTAPHTALTEWKTDYYYHWRECACGEVVSERGDHTFGEDGNCTVCGAEDKTSKGLTYEEYQRNDYYEGDYVNRIDYKVTGVGTCTDEEIIIPRVHDGKYVTYIDEYAFVENTSITGVVLPDSILRIGTGSFAKSGIKSITIPSGVRYIFSVAFTSCANLETVTIEDGMSLEIWLRAFAVCPKLKTINLRKSISEIDMYAITTPNVTINYPGTMAEWGSVNRNANWAYTDEGKYMCPTIVCTDGTIKNHVYDMAL